MTAFYLVNTRIRSKRDIKMVGCVRGGWGGGAVLGIVGGVAFHFKLRRYFMTKACHFSYVYTLSWFP